MPERQLPAREYHGLKSVWRELVKRVGSDALASRLSRVSAVQIGRYGSVLDEFAETFAPIDIVADLEAEVGPVVTTELARLAGHLLVPLPEAARAGLPLGRISAKVMKEVADVLQRQGQMLEDGVLTAVEGPALKREVREAIIALVQMDLQIDEEMRGSRDV